MNTNYLCVVPAKGTSTRLPNKNLKLFGNMPLFLHTVCNIQAAGLTPVVSTDSDIIRSICEDQGVDVYMETVNDIRMENCINSVIAQTKSEADIILFQPTSPFRSKEHILSVISEYEKTYLGIITTKRIRPLLYKEGLPLFDTNIRKTSQQTTEKDYYHYFDGNMVITNHKRYLETGTLLPTKIDLYWNHEEFRSIDIDTETDFIMAEALYRKGYV